MYLYESNFGALGKKRGIRKIFSRAAKIVKKLAPVIVPVVGGAVAAKLYTAYAVARKKAGASDAQIEAETTALQARGISPEQAALQQRPMFSPTPGVPDVSAPVRERAEGEAPAPATAVPGWLLPVAAAAGIALLALR